MLAGTWHGGRAAACNTASIIAWHRMPYWYLDERLGWFTKCSHLPRKTCTDRHVGWMAEMPAYVGSLHEKTGWDLSSLIEYKFNAIVNTDIRVCQSKR
jgi:hypothetical protein